jgi:hypothetical protein
MADVARDSEPPTKPHRRDFNPAADSDRRLRLCPAGVAANSYIGKAHTKREKRKRKRQLLALGGKLCWGMSENEIADALQLDRVSIARLVSDGLKGVRAEADALCMDPEMIFGRKDARDDP